MGGLRITPPLVFACKGAPGDSTAAAGTSYKDSLGWPGAAGRTAGARNMAAVVDGAGRADSSRVDYHSITENFESVWKSCVDAVSEISGAMQRELVATARTHGPDFDTVMTGCFGDPA